MNNQAIKHSEEIADRGYAHPEVLVSTEWVQKHLTDPSLCIIESNEDPLLYSAGHLPGAVEIDWVRDLNQVLQRDYLDGEAFSRLLSSLGISRDTNVIFYGDKSNWWAAYTFWVFKLFGHENCKLMDGGRLKWEQEGRALERDRVKRQPAQYPLLDRDNEANRAFRDAVLRHIEERKKLIDVRSPEEFSGQRLHMEGYPNEGALRGGHIPGAKSVPWSRAINSDGTFKNTRELRAIYENEVGCSPSDDIVVYCRIGERSSHTWFTLKYLLGYKNVRNYDGSWTEWGNLVNVPIEK